MTATTDPDARIDAAMTARLKIEKNLSTLLEERMVARLADALPDGGSMETATYPEVGHRDVTISRIVRADGTPYEDEDGDDDAESVLGESYEAILDDLRSLADLRDANLMWRLGDQDFEFGGTR